MSISRISKAIAEIRCDRRFQSAESMRDVSVDIIVHDLASHEVRWMAQTAVALALRCFKGRIRIHTPKSSSELNPTFRDALVSQAQKVGEPHRLDFTPSEWSLWRLALGCASEGAISADASGWTARINGLFNEKLPAAPPALAFAVACAFAKLFNLAILDARKHASELWDFCLLRFLSGKNHPQEYVKDMPIGRVGLLGAGAIGSAVGYVLSLTQWSGKLDIIDFDHFEGPNLETCIQADCKSVNVPLRKARGLANSFTGHSIIAVERRCEVKAGEPLLFEKWDAFICAADNPETRRLLDNVNTRILINAGLGSTKADVGWVLWTRHCKNDRALSEIYQETQEEKNGAAADVPEEFGEECSRLHYHGVSLGLPFAGLAAGSLLAASLYQHSAGVATDAAYLQMDLFAMQQRMTRL